MKLKRNDEYIELYYAPKNVLTNTKYVEQKIDGRKEIYDKTL